MNHISAKNSLLILVHYFIGYIFIYPMILSLIIYNVHALFGLNVYSTLELLFYVSFVVLIAYYAKAFIVNAWIEFKHSWKRIVKIAWKNYFISLGLLYITNFLITLMTTQLNSNNQSAIESQLQSATLNTVFLAIVFAPFVEEIIFRGIIFGFFMKINKPRTALVMSSCLFGLMHVFLSIIALNFLDIPFALPYIVQGFMITLTYKQTGSFSGAWLFHLINNSVAVILLLLLG